jgi:hypothetical protein
MSVPVVRPGVKPVTLKVDSNVARLLLLAIPRFVDTIKNVV